MSSNDEYLPDNATNDKECTRIDICMEHDRNSQTEERGEPSALLNFPERETVNSEQNCSIQSDSDNEDFNIVVKTRKCARPLVESDGEEMIKETNHSKTATSNSAEVCLDLLNTTGRNEDKDLGWDSDCSDGQSEKCPICLSKFHGQDIGTPEGCDHSFCLECLLEWEKKVNTCPVDRLPFLLILVRQKLEGKIKRRIPVSSHKSPDTWHDQDNDDDESDVTYCEVCGHCDREDRLLLCDSCDLGYHCECLDPPLEMIPVGEWFCPGCDTNKWPEHSNLTEDMMADFREMLRSRFRPGCSVFQHRVIARTLASETVRHRIQRRREAQLESLRNSHRVTDDAAVVTAVTKRRFAHRLGLQRTTQSILQSSTISYSDILALASASYQDDEVSYNSTDDDDDVGYASDRYQQNTSNGFQWNRSASSLTSSTNSGSTTSQRLRVPSPPANHSSIDVLNTILQTQSLLHSNSQDITIEKDGSLTLKPVGSTQQRPQNPQEHSVSTEKYGSLPSSASCSSKPTRAEAQIEQWCGLHSANRQSHVSDNYSGSRYDGQHPTHYASSLCDDSKKKEYQHSNRTKDAKTQSEDEVDIYSDIESVGEEVMEDEPDVSNNEHCNITNIYRSDLHLDAIEEDSDSSENELVIDEDAKIEEEEDSHSGEWNEDNFNVHTLQEESNHNISSPLEGSDYNNFSVREESNHDNFSPQEESNPNFSPQGSSNNNNSSQEESDHNDFTFKQENKCELDVVVPSPPNIYQVCEPDETGDILNQTICEPKSCDTVNSENSAEEVAECDEVEEEDDDDDDELSDNYNESLSNILENEGSSEDEEEKTNKASNEESMSPNSDNITPQGESFPQLDINVISEQRTSFSQHDTVCKSSESCEYISKEEAVEYNYEQEMNITNVEDNQMNLTRTDSEVFSNITEENSLCSSPLNDDRSIYNEEENESQESDIKSISEKEETVVSFSKGSSSDLICAEPSSRSNQFHCLNNEEEFSKHSNDEHQNSNASIHQVDIAKFTESHHSIMPAEDVEDISEAGSDDTKFKDEIDDWEIEAIERAFDNRPAENIGHEETDEKDIDDVEQRVAKLFADEDLSPQHRKVSHGHAKNNINRIYKEDHSCINRSNLSEEEREEGEIIEEIPPKRHKNRSRKSHHRDSLHHHNEMEDYGDHAPRVNISDLPRIPKIKKDKVKVENQEEILSSSKRTSVLSRIDAGITSEISWKRLSRSTRERSYRDGRPKDDRLLFADREIKQKSKRDEDHQRKDEESRRKEERHKRSESEKWREKSDRERSKDRVDKQKEGGRDKSEKRSEKDWRTEKSRDKKEEKEKSFDKFHREEKCHRDKHKHKHKDKDSSKDYKIDKDKMQEKEKHGYLHHSHEREHSKQKDRKPKQIENKFKEVITKKEIKRDKTEKIPERKGTKHEKKRHDESHRHYEHRRKDELRYPTITAIESKEIYTKGDSIIINVNFNRSTGKELTIEEDKSVQKDIKRTKLKEKFSSERRLEKTDMKYSKQKHSSHLLEQTEINISKQSPVERCEPKKKMMEKVQIGEMLWKETEDLMQTNDDIEDRVNDDSQLSNFKSHSSPVSCISEPSEKMSDMVTKDLNSKSLLSPYNDENNGSQNSVLCDSPKRRSPRSPSPPSPTENDSYDPCDPTTSPFLHKSSPLSPENTLCSLECKPAPPPSPELPPLPLEPEPSNHISTQDKTTGSNNSMEKISSSPDISSPDSIPGKNTSVPGSSTPQSQISHFSLPNIKVPPPNYTHKLTCGITASNLSIQTSPSMLPNWSAVNSQLLFAAHGGQPSVQGVFVPSHLTQGTINASQTGILAQTPIAALSQAHIHSSGQSVGFVAALPNIRVPPPQIPLNVSQQPHTIQPLVTTSSVAAGTAIKSTPDITDVIDMEVESPYTPGDSPISSGDKSTSQKQATVLSKDKFDVLLSSTKEHSSSSGTSIKRHHDDVRILAEKVKQSQLFSKSVISVLDKMNKKLLASKKLQQSSSSAKRCKVESKLLDPNRNRHNTRTDAAKSTSSKKESRQEKKEATTRTGETQRTIVDDLPSSAVEMQVKEKFLKKLNRQERVVEEVKLCLKPYYSRREIDKEEYKEIMRKSVPKVCHNRSGDINPVKIKTLIEGYIRKFKHHRKKASKMQKAKIS